MSVWAWVAVGVAAWLGVAVVVGLAIARVVGQIADRVTELLEDEEAWASAPPTRASDAPDETPVLSATSPTPHRLRRR
jgi:hypothetical protein